MSGPCEARSARSPRTARGASRTHGRQVPEAFRGAQAHIARLLAALGKCIAGRQVEELFVDLLDAPMRLQRKDAGIPAGADGGELRAPVDLAQPNRHALGLHGSVGATRAARVLHVEV